MPRLAQLAQELTQLDPGSRVQAGGGLVEEQHLGIVDEGVREAQPLLHAARQAEHVGVALVREVDQLEQVADDAPPLGRTEAVAPTEEVQVLPDLHVVVDPERVRHVAEDAAHRLGVPADRFTGDPGIAGSRFEERREHPQHRRLARAVGADEPEDLARLDGQVHAADRDGPVVALHEPRCLDDGGHSTFPSRATWKLNPALPSGLSFTKRTSSCPVVGST